MSIFRDGTYLKLSISSTPSVELFFFILFVQVLGGYLPKGPYGKKIP